VHNENSRDEWKKSSLKCFRDKRLTNTKAVFIIKAPRVRWEPNKCALHMCAKQTTTAAQFAYRHQLLGWFLSQLSHPLERICRRVTISKQKFHFLALRYQKADDDNRRVLLTFPRASAFPTKVSLSHQAPTSAAS
jgi:hypothetical protein